MHYNPFSYIHSEKDILKLVTTLIANTKGEGKAGDDFWVSATRSQTVKSAHEQRFSVVRRTGSLIGGMTG